MDRNAAIVVLVLSLFYTLYSIQNYALGSMNSPGPGFLPLIIGILMLICSVILIFKPGAPLPFSFSRHELIGFLKVLVPGIMFILLVDKIGFLLTSFATIFLMIKFLKVKGWIWPLVFSVGLSLIVDWLFVSLLDVSF